MAAPELLLENTNSPPFSDISSEASSVVDGAYEINLKDYLNQSDDDDYSDDDETNYHRYLDETRSEDFDECGLSRPNTPTESEDDEEISCGYSVSPEVTPRYEKTPKDDFAEKTTTTGGNKVCSSVSPLFGPPKRSRQPVHEEPTNSKVSQLIEENFEKESKMLDLSKQQLNEIPESLLSLNHLKRLILKDNKVRHLSTEFFPSLPNLFWLDLRHNRLKHLPRNIGEHPNLKTLLLEGNQLQELPNELGLLNKLEGLSYRNNPLTKPPPEILSLGLKEILYYLRDKLPIYNEDCLGNIRVGLRKLESGPVMNVLYKKDNGGRKNSRSAVHRGNFSFITVPKDPFDELVQRKFQKDQIFSLKKMEQEETQKAVQRMKSQLVLKAWREKAKTEQHTFDRLVRSNPDLLKVDVVSPYDTDENFMSLPSRIDLINSDILDKKIERAKYPPGFVESLRYKTQQEIEKEIHTILNKLQSSCHHQDDISLDEAAADLKKVEELQRQLSKLFHNII